MKVKLQNSYFYTRKTIKRLFCLRNYEKLLSWEEWFLANFECTENIFKFSSVASIELSGGKKRLNTELESC
jgi:hypothetical protein